MCQPQCPSFSRCGRPLLAAGADALTKDNAGWTPLAALHSGHSHAAEALLAAMPTDAALEDLCSANTLLARQLLPAFIVDRPPHTAAQWTAAWAAFPTDSPCPGLGHALPAALACSVDQAGQLVRRLPAADAQRLRTAALCLTARPHPSAHGPLHLPSAIVQRILSHFACA